MSQREALTNKAGKALCLAYRQGHRCGRVAHHVITRKVGVSGVTWDRMAVCDECRAQWIDQRGAALLESSSKAGYTVKSEGWSGWIKRVYAPIVRQQ